MNSSELSRGPLQQVIKLLNMKFRVVRGNLPKTGKEAANFIRTEQDTNTASLIPNSLGQNSHTESIQIQGAKEYPSPLPCHDKMSSQSP